MTQIYKLRLACLAVMLTGTLQFSAAQVTPPPPVPTDTLMPKAPDAPAHDMRSNEPAPVAVAPQPAGPVEYKNKYRAGQFVKEFIPYVKSPLHWSAGEWAIFGGVAAACTGIIFTVDEPVAKWVKPQKPIYGKRLDFTLGEQWGGFYFIPITSIALYSHGWIAKNHKTKKLGFEIAQAAAYSEIISFTAKQIFGRYRPFLTTDPTVFRFGQRAFSSPYNSFPAGHVNAAMALSVVLSRNTNSGLLKVLAFVPTLFTAAERVLNERHWVSDLVFGGAIGYATGVWVTSRHEAIESGLQVSSVYPLGVKYTFK